MSFDIAFTDLANGTQATVAITGTDAGSSNTVKAYQAKTGTWSTVGTRTGNGNATCTFPATGLYWVRCDGTVSAAAAISNIIPGTITSSSSDAWDIIMTNVLTDLQSLATAGYLPGLTSNDIERYTDIKAMLLAMTGPGLPAIGLAPGDMEEIKNITSADDDVGYPILVNYRDVADPKQGDDENESLRLIRGRIRRRYHGQRCPGYTRAQDCTVTPMSSHQFEQMGYNAISSASLLRFTVREPRGIY